MMRRIRRLMLGFALVLGFVLLALLRSARSDPWLPNGSTYALNFEYRDYFADRSFTQGEFGTATVPSSSHYDKREVRITGRGMLAPTWMVFFDLRAAAIRKVKHKVTLTASGPEDQQIGLAHVLEDHPALAQAVALSVIIPTGSGTLDPALSTGQHAAELDYWLWFRPGGAASPAYASVSLGPRIFAEGGAPQIRFSGLVGAPITRRWSVYGSLFLSRTLGPNGGYISGDAFHNATNYNLLRPGLGLAYRLTHGARIHLLYEQEVAGENLHAGRRITLGIHLRG